MGHHQRGRSSGGDRPATGGGHTVLYDDRVDWDWKTHNKDTFVPKSAGEAAAQHCAGVKTSRMHYESCGPLNDQRRPKTSQSMASHMSKEEARRNTQLEYYGHQFSFGHPGGGSPLDGASRKHRHVSTTSQSYGHGVDNQVDVRNIAQEQAGIGDPMDRRPMSRLNVYENANNNRNSWNRNESQLGEVIFGVEYESPGIPKRPSRQSKREYAAHPTYAGEANVHHRTNPHFTTTKAAVDHEAVGLALEEDLYRTANPQGIGFRVYGKAHDDTTVSADSPSWFQLPGVTVNKLSAIQLGSLVQWKAPIPMKHTDGELLTNFFGDNVQPVPIEDDLHVKRSLTEPNGVPMGQSRATTPGERVRPASRGRDDRRGHHSGYSQDRALDPHDYNQEVQHYLPPTMEEPDPEQAYEYDDGMMDTAHQSQAHQAHHYPSSQGGRWTPHQMHGAPSSRSGRSDVLSEANLAHHNLQSRGGGTPPLPPAHRQAKEPPNGSWAVRASERFQPGSEASFSVARSVVSQQHHKPPRSLRPGSVAQSDYSAVSRRTASIYGNGPMINNRPVSPALSATDLAMALKRAAAGEELQLGNYAPSSVGSKSLRSQSSRQSAAREQVARAILAGGRNVYGSRSVSARSILSSRN